VANTDIIAAEIDSPIRIRSPFVLPAAQQPTHSPHDENQYRNRDNCQRQKVVNGIGKNVIRVSRVEAIEAFKGGWQRYQSFLANSSRCSLGW
jgi:hypothetical protein